MAFATITFPTTIFEFFQSGLSLVCVNKKFSGFLRFYGYFLNGEVLSIHRSSLSHLINVFGNLYSSHFLALPKNYTVIGLFTMRAIHTVTAFNYESWLGS